MAFKHVSYESLKQSARHYRGEGGYCTVIMVALVLGWKFGKARSEWKRRGRRDGCGTYFRDQKQLLADHGVTLKLFSYRTGGTLSTVASKVPSKGMFLVYSRGHVSVVRDGVLEDWATDSRKRVIDIYQVVYN